MDQMTKVGAVALVFTIVMAAAALMLESLVPVVVWLLGMLVLGAIANALRGGGSRGGGAGRTSRRCRCGRRRPPAA